MDIEKELDCNTGSIPPMTFEEAIKYFCVRNPDLIVKVFTKLRGEPCAGCIRELKKNHPTCFSCARWKGERTDWFEKI